MIHSLSSFSAIVREGWSIGDPGYHDAELVCLEDGSEMKSLLMIKEHQECGHDKFFLVGANELLPEYRAMNADQASRLYCELTADGNIVESSRFWALSRRKDWEVQHNNIYLIAFVFSHSYLIEFCWTTVPYFKDMIRYQRVFICS